MENGIFTQLYNWLSGESGQRLIPWAIALMVIGAGGFLLFMRWKGLTPEAAVPFKLQRAATAQEFGQVVRTWSDGSAAQIAESIRVFRVGTLIFDTLWPLGYGLLGVLVLARLTRPMAQEGHPGWALMLTALFVLAVVFDFAENIQSIRLLSGVKEQADLLSLAADQFAWVRLLTRAKWGLIGAGLLASLWLWARK